MTKTLLYILSFFQIFHILVKIILIVLLNLTCQSRYACRRNGDFVRISVAIDLIKQIKIIVIEMSFKETF